MLPGAAIPRAQPSVSAALCVSFVMFVVPPFLLLSWRDPGLLVYLGASGDCRAHVL